MEEDPCEGCGEPFTDCECRSEQICDACNGSGEGQYDGANCWQCSGQGERNNG